MSTNDYIFSLDIGTRTVIGIVLIPEGDKFKIIATEIETHKTRAMLDGQINDIEKVTEVSKNVKDKLENKIGFKLEKVAIAAAGRVLKTKNASIRKSVSYGSEVTFEEIETMELDAIQIAQNEIQKELYENDNTNYYCVGYTVTGYFLNNYLITSLEGHKGTNIGVDVLATFLSQSVIDSLYTVMKKINLEVISLTLEPIAAINVVIPKDIRLLNIALVDVGAGTSDIAIAKDGAIVAYDMAPIAGDEITECICQKYLIDFNTAEKIKLDFSKQDDVCFTDIIGIEQRVSSKEIYTTIIPTVKRLSDVIVKKILESNKKAPNAVFLVGGGSQIEGLKENIAEGLNIPIERVAIRNRKNIKNIIMDTDNFLGPDIVTPIGIGITAIEQQGRNFINVLVNDVQTKLFNTKNLTVADALIANNFKSSSLIAKNGKNIKYILNNEEKIKFGDYGKQAQIYVNKKPLNLKSIIQNKDLIEILPAINGKDAEIRIEDIVDLNKFDVKVNDIEIKKGYLINNGDVIYTTYKKTNNTERQIIQEKTTEYIESEYIVVLVNKRAVKIPNDKSKHMFIDIFNYIEFDTKKSDGIIVLKLNGKDAGYTDIINDGDNIEIYWNNK